MNTDSIKRYELFSGIVLLIGGCLFLLLLVFEIATTSFSELTILTVLSMIGLFLFVVCIFAASADAFIKYGISKGIDYCLDKYNNT